MKRILITFALAIFALTACKTQIDPTFIQIPWQNPTQDHILLYTESEGFYHHSPFDPVTEDYHLSSIFNIDSLYCFEIIDRISTDPVDTLCIVIEVGGVGSGSGYTIYETDSVFTSDRTADLGGNYLRFTNGTFAIEGGGNSTYTEPTGGYFVFNPDSGAIRAGSRIFGEAGMPPGSINLGEDNEPGALGIHIGALNRSLNFIPTNERYEAQILIGYGNEGAGVPFSFSLGEANRHSIAAGGDLFDPSGNIGWGNENESNRSILIGANSFASGNGGGTFGEFLNISNQNEISIGIYNTIYAPPTFVNRHKTRIFSIGTGTSPFTRTNAVNVFSGFEVESGVRLSRWHFNPLRENEFPDYEFKFTGNIQVDSLSRPAVYVAGFSADSVLTIFDLDSLPTGADVDLYLKEINQSNDTSFFRIFDRIEDTLHSELFLEIPGVDSVFTDETITGNGITNNLSVDTSIIATKSDLLPRVFSASDGEVIFDENPTEINFSAVDIDEGGIIDQINSFTFEIVESGKYLINFGGIIFDNCSSGSFITSYLTVNSNPSIGGGITNFVNDINFSFNNSAVLELSQSDRLQVFIFNSDDTCNASVDFGVFSIVKL